MLAHNKINHIFMFFLSYLVMKPIWILEEAMDFLEVWSKETTQLRLNHRFFITAKHSGIDQRELRRGIRRVPVPKKKKKRRGGKALQTKPGGDQHCLRQCISYQYLPSQAGKILHCTPLEETLVWL